MGSVLSLISWIKTSKAEHRISSLFDVSHYLSTNPDVARSGIPPRKHYLLHGSDEGRRPHRLFDPNLYRLQYPDVAEAEVEPLIHYLTHGRKEGRRPHPLFDPQFYVVEYGHLLPSGTDPLMHYLHEGWKRGFKPHPLFEPFWYLRANPDIQASGEEPLGHYLRKGANEGRRPHPLFDPIWYSKSNGDLGGLEPLTHYVLYGSELGRRPNCIFDPGWYRETYPDVKASGMEPFAHFIRYGRVEGRQTAAEIDSINLSGYILDPEFTSEFTNAMLRATLRALDRASLLSRSCIVFVISYDLTEATNQEGLQRRVEHIDRLFAFLPRLYLNISGKAHFPALRMINENRWQLTIGEGPASEEIVRQIFSKAASIYAHSIYSLIPDVFMRYIARRAGKLILDVHGVVPEETQYLDSDNTVTYSNIENFFVREADCVVVVSERMRAHFRTKYNKCLANQIVLPYIVSPEHVRNYDSSREGVRQNIVYIGGVQPWQNIEAIAELVKIVKFDCFVHIYTPDVEHISRVFADNDINVVDSNITIATADSDRLFDILRNMDYGLILRDNILINNVSCPTKLIEYLAYNIVPIVLSDELGDFKKMGICCVGYDDFIKGRIPTESERRHMSAVNAYVLRKIRHGWATAANHLCRVALGRRSASGLLLDDERSFAVRVG